MNNFVSTLLSLAFLLSSPARAQWAAVLAGSPPAAANPLVVANAWKNSAAATSVAVTVSPSAGSLLVLCGSNYSGLAANQTVVDNIDGATGWTSVVTNDVGTGLRQRLWYKKNIPAGITSITLDSGASSVISQAIIHEVTGASTTTPFTTGESSSNSGAATTNPQTAAVTNATANSVFFAYLVNLDPGNPAQLDINGTGTNGTWNLKSSTNSQVTNGSGFGTMSVPNIIVSSGASTVHGWTTGSFTYATIAAAFH